MSFVLALGSAGNVSCSGPRISRQGLLIWPYDQHIMSLDLVLGSADNVSCSGPKISRQCFLFWS